MKKSEITILLTLAFVQFTHILDAMVMMPMGPTLKNSFHIETSAFNLLVGSYGLSAFFSAIIATFWMDRFDRKKVLLILYIGFLIGTFCCAMSPNYNFLLAARIFTGFFGGVAGAVILSIVGDVIPLERRAQGMGILMGGFALASVAGVPIGIYLSETFSWHAPFFLVIGIGFFVLLSIIFIVPSVRIHLDSKAGLPKINLYKAVFSNANQMRALLFSFAYVLAHFAIIPNLTDYFVNNLHFDLKTQLIWIYIVGGILSTFTSPLWGKIADRIGKFKMFAILSLLATIPIFITSNFTGTTLLQLLPVTAMFFIFSGGRMIPSSAMVTSAVPPQIRGGFMSLNSAVQQLAIGLISLIGAMVITNENKQLQHYEIMGYIGIGFTVVAIFLGWGVKAVNDERKA